MYNPYTGANVSGPPPKPLKLFKVAVNDTGVKFVNVGRGLWFARVDSNS